MSNELWRQESLAGRWIMSPGLLVPLALAAVGIIFVSGLLEYEARKSDAEQLFARQGRSLVEALAVSANHSLTAAERMEREISRRILSNLALLEQLDRQRPSESADLEQLQRLADFQALAVYDASGNRRMTAGFERFAVDSLLAQSLLDAVTGGLDRYVLFLPDPGRGDAMLGLRRRSRGGVLIGGVNAEQLRELRQVSGLGRLLITMQQNEDVEYLVVQNEEGIIAGSFGTYQLSVLNDDAFLVDALSDTVPSTRMLAYGESRIFEAVAPFMADGEPVGLLRAGLSLQHFDALELQARRRMLIFGILVIIVAVILINFVLGNRHRKLLRTGLLRLQRYTNTILDHQSSGVLAVSNDRTIQVCNQEAARILNREPAACLGVPLHSLATPIAGVIEQTLTGGMALSRPRRLPAGNGVTLSVRTTLLHAAEGTDQGAPDTCIAIVDDITDQVRLETKVRQQEKLAAMGRLASTVAHEIRNPLNAISMIVSLLDRRYAREETDTAYKDKFKAVNSEIGRINSIVEQFIRFARPPKLEFRPIVFPELFRDLETLYQETMQRAQIRWTVSAESHRGTIGDAGQLKQMLVNLIQNARDALAGPGAITITGTADAAGYTIRVADTGAGIKPEDLDRIFDLYFTSGKDQGTGIGLALVQQIVTRHQGTITVDSAPGRGAVFTILLPYLDQSEAA